jgi:HK97 family phage major capsid protein
LSANPTVLTGLNGNVSIPKINPGSTSAFVTEGSAVSQSDPTLQSVSLSQKTGGAFVDISRTLMMNTGDSFSVENMVRNDLSRSLATMFDAGSVSGSGASGNPTGIENVTGVNTSSFSSAGSPSYPEIIAMQGLIENDNVALDGDSTFYITTPTMNSTLKTTAKNGAGSRFVQEDGFIDGYPVLISSQVTSNTVILGKFSDFIVGVYGGLEITVDPFSLSTTGTQRIVALASMDFAVRHPVSFCVSA